VTELEYLKENKVVEKREDGKGSAGRLSWWAQAQSRDFKIWHHNWQMTNS